MTPAELPAEGLLHGIAWSDVRDLLREAPVRELRDGHVLARPGQPLDKVWLVLDGQVGIYVGEQDDEPIMRLGAGEPVGELAAIDGGPRSAWVSVIREARVAEIAPDAFRGLLERSHAAALNLLYLVARRIRTSNEAIARSGRELARTERAQLIDPLTGVRNRRWFDQHMPAIVAGCARAGTPLSVVLVDVDHFKRINDTFGHPTGDAVLVEMGRQLRQRFRSDDEVARYGGEEFVVVLPGLSASVARETVERVRKALAFTGVPHPVEPAEVVRFTVSAGVASLRRGEGVSALVARADAALYRAKAAGRNCVVSDARAG